MASPTRSALRGRFAALLAPLVALALAPPALALRVVDYNILNYPGNSGPARAPYYRTILDTLGMNADVIVTEEQISSAGATEFLSEVLNTMDPPGTWAMVPFIDGNDTDAELYYRVATVQFLGQWAFYPNPANQLRYIHVYRIKPVGYSSETAELRIYAGHLKASDTAGDRAQRLAECTGLRDSMNAMPAGTHAMICGDMNFYKQSTDPGYSKLLESQVNNVGRVYDVLPSGDWHDNIAYAPYHSQSPCKDGTCASGAATGGMDDRFDMILPTINLGTGQGLAVATGTMFAVGNDGQHFRSPGGSEHGLNITDPPTIPEGANFATALKLASDHLPVRVDLQVPAMISTDASLAFGSVIVGAPTQSQDLTISNPAAIPGDSLNCAFSTSSPFGAPGPLAVVAGGSAPATVTMATDIVDSFHVNLTINSDAPDNSTTLVALSGTVLDHAQVSLDSLSALLADTLDFGEQTGGGFGPLIAEVHNRSWTALRARLLVSAASIAGGDGRFAIQGFTPGTLIAGTAGRWNVTFDETGATLDSTYTATLTFSSGDESLPGASAQPDVAYALLARVRGATGVPPAAPTTTRLYRPVPNPMLSASTLRFDLALTTRARLEIFDASGRRVAVVADREFAAGSYSMRWDGRRDGGAAAGAGLYFVRLSGRGLAPRTERLAIVR
ncbi:MAG TPA: FlgD immunoglobulin-like domain containing protein [Terriglobales bacterium]|nr:FlgD immunoglobulin-like domain containing protein [Terriglobales bacterium]